MNKSIDILKKGKISTPMKKAERLIYLQSIQKQIKPEIEALKADLLDATQKLGVLTLKTDKYTISRAKKITPEVVDFQALKKALKKNKIPFGTQEVFADYMKETFKKLIAEEREMDGLEGKETEYIIVRVKETK